MIEDPSLRILIRTTPVMACVKECSINLDTTVMVNSKRTSCSMMLDRVLGNIFSFPKKYPLMMEEMQMKGRVSPMAISG